MVMRWGSLSLLSVSSLAVSVFLYLLHPLDKYVQTSNLNKNVFDGLLRQAELCESSQIALSENLAKFRSWRNCFWMTNGYEKEVSLSPPILFLTLFLSG